MFKLIGKLSVAIITLAMVGGISSAWAYDVSQTRFLHQKADPEQQVQYLYSNSSGKDIITEVCLVGLATTADIYVDKTSRGRLEVGVDNLRSCLVTKVPTGHNLGAKIIHGVGTPESAAIEFQFTLE